MAGLASAYIAIAVLVLLVIAALMFFVRRSKNQGRLSPLAAIAMLLVFTAIIFGEDRLMGYSLIAAGVLLAVVDLVLKSKK
jgi:hypothetical protein